MEVRSYRDLKVWQLGMELAKEVYLLTRAFPKHEVYGLSGQMRRAVVSVPSNVAEGHARASTKEFMHHVSIAQGSLAELETQLLLAESLEYCNQEESARLLDKCAEESKMLNGLRRRLADKARP